MAFTVAQIQSSVLPTGAATETTLAAISATLTAISAKLPATLGQKAMAGSLAVTFASDQTALPVTGPLTDTQLRAAAVPVSLTSVPSHAVTGPLTDAQLRASAVPISGTVSTGGLTDTQLRATAVPISAAALPLPAGAATDTAQGAALAGESGPMVQASVKNSASLPSYTDGTVNPLSMSPSGALRVTARPVEQNAGVPTRAKVVTAAGSNLNALKPSSGTIIAITLASTRATGNLVLKLYNKASAPVIGTDTALVWMTIVCPPGQTVSPNLGPTGILFPSGIACAITAGTCADNDATATGASDGCLTVWYA